MSVARHTDGGWPGWSMVSPQPATAAWPGVDWETAVAQLAGPATHTVQLCPQSQQVLDETVVDRLKARWPTRRWRLHANPKLWDLPPIFYDASTVSAHLDSCFEPLARLSARLGADVYSLHAGRTQNASRAELLDNVARLEERFGCTVAVEGMYPDRRGCFHVADSEGYQWLLESGVAMAIDVSHLHIVRCTESGFDEGLLEALLESDRCVEVHLSHNNGRADQHRRLPAAPPWWWSAVCQARARRPELVVFAESNQRQRR
ncbi:MAG: hypothetical protein P8R54_19225 [Myxococcota bacterium]|nr:hypothetical protein [Myxococcota bacterium]